MQVDLTYSDLPNRQASPRIWQGIVLDHAPSFPAVASSSCKSSAEPQQISVRPFSQDERGAVLRVALPTFRSTRLLEFHSGPITGLDTHPGDHVVATAGEDATVSLSGKDFETHNRSTPKTSKNEGLGSCEPERGS